MSFNDAMNRMLVSQGGTLPHVTADFGEVRPSGPHQGVDFNYVGGQNGINLQYPIVRAPIAGHVTFVGGGYGMVKIRDSEGNSHEILHTHSQSVSVGQQVSAGTPVGTMGGRGPGGPNQYARHVHYQIRNPQGQITNPQAWWDQHDDTPTQSASQNVVQSLSFAFPFRAANGKTLADEHAFHEWLSSEDRGNFAVSGTGMWHGGIHVSADGAGRQLDLAHGVRCIAAGEVVAYRMNHVALMSQISTGQTGRYSSAFTLVRHTLEYPAGNRLAFFSLYMHLQSVAEYVQKAMPAPGYWVRCYEVTQHAADKPKASSHISIPVGHIGLNIRADAKGGSQILGILPRGAQVRIGERRNKGLWGKIEAIESGSIVPPALAGTVVQGASTGWVYLGKERGHFVLAPAISQAQCDQVIVPETPIRINAGDLIGHLGQYWLPDNPAQEHQMVHIEIFCGSDLPSFLAKTRAAAKDITDFSKLPLLRIDKAVKLFQVKKTNAQGQPVYEEGANAPQTAVAQIYSQAALDAFPAEHKGPKDNGPGPGQPWWYVTSANSRYEDISGWVRNRQMPPDGGVTRESPHAWADFETVIGADAGNPTIFNTVDAYLDHVLCEDKPATGGIDKLKPLVCNVYRALSPMRNEAQAADEMRAVKNNKWLRFRASRLIPMHRSEWASQSEYQSFFDKVLQRIAKEPYHDAEIERLKKLVWWDEVKKSVKGTFPDSPDVFYIHPIALAGNFSAEKDILALIRKIGDVISSGEGGYESYNTGTKNVPNGAVGHSYMHPPPGTVTNKTINEIIATDSLSGTDPNRFFATGKYQTIIATLRLAKTAMNLTGGEKYDPQMQERVFAEYLLNKAGGGALSSFVKNGIGTVDDAQYAAAKEWASIAVPAGRVTRDGSMSTGVQSYYQSAANSASITSTDKLKAILQSIAK